MRKIAIGDVHGCYENLVELLEEKVQITHDDEIFLLGDLISKGNRNRDTLDYVFKQLEAGYKIRAIRGNHEEKILMLSNDIDMLTAYFDKYNLHDLLDGNFEGYLRYLNSLPYFIISGKFLLLHSEINFGVSIGSRDLRAIFGSHKLKDLLNIEGIESFNQIYGHLARPKSDIESDIKTHKKRIGLDGGCVYGQYGYLFGLNLQNFEYWYSRRKDTIDGNLQIHES